MIFCKNKKIRALGFWIDSEAIHERCSPAIHEVPGEFAGYISAHGVTFESAMEGDFNGLASPLEIKSAVSSRKGGIYEDFKYLAITYARSSIKSSQLEVRKDSDKYIVEMGVYYRLIFAKENGRLCLTEFHYLNYDGED